MTAAAGENRRFSDSPGQIFITSFFSPHLIPASMAINTLVDERESNRLPQGAEELHHLHAVCTWKESIKNVQLSWIYYS